MPRFDNEGFNPKQRIDNDSRDRSVPDSENYYRGATPDFGFNPNQPSGAEVRDNQNPYNNYVPMNQNTDLRPPNYNSRQYNQYQQPYQSYQQSYDDEAARRQKEREEYSKMRAQQRQQKQGKKKVKSKKNKKRIVLGVIIAIILILVLMVESVLGKMNYDEHIDNKYVAAQELEHSALVKNILLLGVDARKNQKKETSRPDTMMLISLDMKHHCIKMTSFLRDTWVYVPTLQREQRLNASTGKTGYSGVVDAIEYNFGVDVDGYIVTNFEMFQELVDSVGGVEINVTKKEAKEVNKHKKRYGNVHLPSGTNTLNGKQALAYCRIRKIDTDFNRTKRQRTVMTAILDKAKKNPFKLYKMASASAEYIETDLTKSQLRGVAAFAGMCVSGEMFQEKVPFEGTWEYANKSGASVIAINIKENKAKLIDYIYNKTAADLKAQQNTK